MQQELRGVVAEHGEGHMMLTLGILLLGSAAIQRYRLSQDEWAKLPDTPERRWLTIQAMRDDRNARGEELS